MQNMQKNMQNMGDWEAIKNRFDTGNYPSAEKKLVSKYRLCSIQKKTFNFNTLYILTYMYM